MRQRVSQKKKVAVLGASGATGRRIVRSALARGYDVVAFVRSPGSLPPADGLTETRWDDVSERDPLVRSLPGVDLVISALGGAASGPTKVCTDAMATAIPVMQESGVSRLLVVSAHGVLESRDRSLYSVAVWASVGERMRDKESMEPLVVSSGLEWTIVRPPALRDTAATGVYRVGEQLPIRVWDTIGRADLANFLVEEGEAGRFVGAYPRLRR